MTAENSWEGTGVIAAAAKEVKMAYNNTRSGGGQWNNGGGPRSRNYGSQYNNQYGSRNFGGQYGGQRNDDPVVFDIREHIGVLSVRDNGWRKEVNSVAWNGNPPKIDIREWAPGYGSMSRGITLHELEAARLYSLLGERYGSGNPVDKSEKGMPRPVHAAPGNMQMNKRAQDTMEDAERDIPFMDDRPKRPLPDNYAGELYDDQDGQDFADISINGSNTSSSDRYAGAGETEPYGADTHSADMTDAEYDYGSESMEIDDGEEDERA